MAAGFGGTVLMVDRIVVAEVCGGSRSVDRVEADLGDDVTGSLTVEARRDVPAHTPHLRAVESFVVSQSAQIHREPLIAHPSVAPTARA
ncbi:hypothetical protein ABTZ99_01125 [Actinosynnema sp. NPDC002837]